MKYPTVDVYVKNHKQLQSTVAVKVNDEEWPVIACESIFKHGMNEIVLRFHGTLRVHQDDQSTNVQQLTELS